MTKICDNDIITMHRGDSLEFSFEVDLGTSIDYAKYMLQDGDSVYFGVMEPHEPFENGLIRKTYDKSSQNESGSIKITIDSTDTENLLPGTYYYEIKLKISASSEIKTLKSRTKFLILE